MRFLLLDSIRSYEPGVRLTAQKGVALSEEYLADHFPEFPVLPGVFMLEAATQAAGWLLRLSEDFAHSIILLKEAKNIKYADFVSPGNTLVIDVEMIKKDDRLATFKIAGRVDERTTLTGRLVLERYNLADENPEQDEIDQQLKERFQELKKVLLSSDAMTTTPA